MTLNPASISLILNSSWLPIEEFLNIDISSTFNLFNGKDVSSLYLYVSLSSSLILSLDVSASSETMSREHLWDSMVW